MAIKVVQRAVQNILLQGDGASAIINIDLSQPVYGLAGHTIQSLSVVDPNNVYTITNNLVAGSIAGSVGLSTNPAITSLTIISLVMTITYI